MRKIVTECVKKIGLGLGLAGLCIVSTGARAADDQTPTFFLTATGGYSVYKSEMVQSNDTSTTVGYGFGVYAGDDHEIGLILNRESSSFGFKLNDSSIKLAWQDVELLYRLGYFHLGLLATSSSAWIVSTPPDADGDGIRDTGTTPDDFLDVTTQGMGGSFGLQIPLSKRSMTYFNVVYVTTSTTQEKAVKDSAGTVLNDERPLSIGPRMDIDLGGSLKVTKSLLDVRAGFKYRTYQLSVDGQAYSELLNTTYLGLQASWFF